MAIAAVALSAIACAAAPPAPDGPEPGEESQVPAASEPTQPSAPPGVPAVSASRAVTRLGVEVLLADSLSLLAGRRVGLITNHTGVSRPGGPSGRLRSTIDVLHEHPAVQLVALFSPEHGIRGDVDRKIASGVDDRTGLPIHSLYGETRKPTPEMLRGVDVLVFDIQDIGTRYYSYVWTMALAMEAAGEHGVAFVVLDRPNPIGGRLVQGNVKPSYMPVAFYEAAMRHGLTAGELARYVAGQYDLPVDLHVVPMQGWERSMWWEDTGIEWRPPSPNMPSVESATHYPGTCLFEGTNMSVGRGTPEAFQLIGAPWLDAGAVADALRERAAGGELPGVAVEPVTFVPEGPTDGKYPGATVRGLRFTVTDRATYDPVHTAVAALLEITRRHPHAFAWREGWFDGLAGGPHLRQLISRGATLGEIVGPWPAERQAFERAVEPYLIYR